MTCFAKTNFCLKNQEAFLHCRYFVLGIILNARLGLETSKYSSQLLLIAGVARRFSCSVQLPIENHEIYVLSQIPLWFPIHIWVRRPHIAFIKPQIHLLIAHMTLFCQQFWFAGLPRRQQLSLPIWLFLLQFENTSSKTKAKAFWFWLERVSIEQAGPSHSIPHISTTSSSTNYIK